MLLLFIQQQDRLITHLVNEAADNTAHVVEQAISEQIGLLKGLAASHSLDQGDFTDFRIDAQRLWNLHPEWRTVILTDEHDPLLNLRFPAGTPVTPIRDSGSLKTVWDTKEPFVGNLSNGFVAIRVPVIRDDRMMYTLVAPANPEFFRGPLQGSEKIGHWDFMIVGGDGIVISASGQAPATQGNPLHESFLQNREALLSSAGMLFSAPVTLLPSGWRVIVFGPEKFVTAPFIKKRVVVYLGAGFSIILAAVMTLMFSSAWVAGQKAITLRKQMEEIQEAQLQQKEMIKASKVGLWDWDLRTGQIRYSEEWKNQIGYENHDIGNDVKEFEDRIHPDDRESTLGKIRRSISGMRQDHKAEFRFRHKDGSYRWILAQASVIPDDSGQPVRMIGSHLDITERRQMEETLKDSQSLLSTLIRTIPDLVWLKDPEGIYLACNYRFECFFGAKEKDILGKTDYDFMDKDLADFFRRYDKEAMKKGQPNTNEEEVVFADDGHHEILETIKTPMYRDNGQFAGVLGIGRNITDRKRSEQEQEKLQAQLIQAQRMESVGRLAGGVAHDFNNMLGIIIGNAEMILDDMNPADPFSDNLQEIRKAAERSANLTRQLLAFARKQTIDPKTLNINEVLDDMLKMLKRLIGEDITLAWMPAEELWKVKVDPTQMDQVFANLCINARDAIKGVGKITIETANSSFDEEYSREHAGVNPGDYVMIAVSDNGSGMDKKTLDNLFEPFFTTKDVGKGSGLGLATVYGIVKQNNGFINVYSEPGKGSTFKIYFPRQAETAMTKPKNDVRNKPPTGNETILLVEDEEAILKMTRRMLERLGYTVLTAHTPGEAVRIAEESKTIVIHLLMTDVVMPEMNGRDLSVKILGLHPHLRCLFMSGYTANVIAHHGVLDKGVQFINKPFSMQDLAVKLREVLDENLSRG
ncbi:MAG: PAS domain S-box protein [Desulfobacula sp.]|jgi:PAS domain S-box-containing protein